MKNTDYYNRHLSEIFYLKEKSFKDSRDGIYFNLMGANFSILLPYPISLFSVIFLMIDSYNKYRKDKFFKKNFNDLYRNSLEYQDVYKIYKIIIDELVTFFNKQELDNEMKIFAYYYYMLSGGYLSVDHQFCFTTNIELDLFLHGVSIMEGKGKCLNIASMFTDLLRLMNYDAWNLSMCLTDEKLISLNDYYLKKDKNNKVDIVRDSSDVLRTIDDFIKINHLVTIVRDSKHSYVIDPTNNSLFLVDFDKQVYQGCNNYYVEYLSEFNMGKRVNINDLLLSTDMHKLESRVDDYDKTFKELKEREELLEKFYLEHKCLYEEVVSKKKVLMRENRCNNK